MSKGFKKWQQSLCKAKTKKGNQCKNYGGASGFCGSHNPGYAIVTKQIKERETEHPREG